MKKGSKRAMRQILSLMLVLTMLMGTPGLTALAASGDAGTAAESGLPELKLKLWYDEPASQTGTPGSAGSGVTAGSDSDIWQQDTLPIGNGIIGANIYGEIGTERLTLNEQTLWLGGPSDSRQDYNGGNIVTGKGENGQTIKEIQKKFASGDAAGARALVGKLTGADEFGYGYGYFAPWGELQITTAGVTSADSGTYQRWLSLDDGLAGVEFRSGGVDYTREYLASNPDHVLAVKLTASADAAFTISLKPSAETGNGSVQAQGNDTIALCGQLADNQLKFASYLRAVPATGTSVSTANNQLTVTGREVTLFFSAATDYEADYPKYRTKETDEALAARVKEKVDAAAGKGYDAVKEDHMEDYQGLMGRMTLDLGQTTTDKTTDALLRAYNNGTADDGERRLLEVMLFQYGRYLTVASSRENSILPSNLQGIWNNRTNPPWHSDFHTNVNLQMNYWPTYVTNLAESADPIVRYIDSLREPGRVTAKVYAGIESTEENPENGFMAHTQNTPYGWTCPGWSFNWGWSPGAIAWMIQNCWEYYEYTGDVEYMRKNIYPMMKEYTRLYEQLLVDVSDYALDFIPTNLADDDGPYYATVPAYSPEHGPATVGNAFEQALVWQLLEDTITAAEVLNEDADKIDDWKYIQAHLLGPVQVGATGELKEWFDEYGLNSGGYAIYEDGSTLGNGDQGYGHRHVSHMLGLFPGDLVQLRDEWVEAARVSMNYRTFNSTGWGMGHRINIWARLRDAENCYQLIQNLFSGGMYNNLWDAHAPFQIDGNFAYTAGVAEMLMQSNMGYIDLLPALPDAWETGSFDGLIARGNFRLSAAWTKKNLDTVRILSKNGGECVVAYPGLSMATVKDANGSLIDYTIESNDKISFETAVGMTYTITGIPARANTVDGFEALRVGSETVLIRWKAEAGTTYQVYRQVEGGDLIPVGNTATSGPVTDDAAYEALGNIQYYIAANDGAPSSVARVQDLRNMARVDDQYSLDGKDPNGSPIVYTGNWNNWNQESGDYMTTCRYVNEGNVNGQTAALTFLGTGIQAMGHPYNASFTMSIDGGAPQTFTTTESSSRNQVLGTINDLTLGVHTVVLTLVQGKSDFDGFNVLGGGTLEEDHEEGELVIGTVGGITNLWVAGERLQLTSSLSNVTWEVVSDHVRDTDCNRPLHKHTWDADTQTLTAGYAKEVITVKARKGDKVSAPVEITINPTTAVTIIEESDGSINWTGTWTSYSQTNTFHGGSKKDGNTGASFSYTFTGTGVAVIVQKNGNTAWQSNGMAVVLDDVSQGNYSTFQSGLSTSGVGQQVLFEKMDLENKEHTITVTGTGSGINMDCIEIYAPNTDTDVPKLDAETQEALKDLMAAVAEAAEHSEAAYTPRSWKILHDAVAAAGNYLNNPRGASATDIKAAAQAIRDAIKGLVGQALSAPKNLKASYVGGTRVLLQWDAVDGASGYVITVDGNTTHETTVTTYSVTGLVSGMEHTFSVKAVNNTETSAETSIRVTTKDTVAPSQVTGLTWDNATKTLSWIPATDNVVGGAITYIVMVDNETLNDYVTGTSIVLSNLAGEQNRVTVIAVDAAGNQSVPASIVIAPEYTVTAINATISGGKTTFRPGEVVTVTATVPAGKTLTSWTVSGIDRLDGITTDNPLTFSMPAHDVTVEPHFDEEFWNVEQQLTNLASSFKQGRVVRGGELSITFTAAASYEPPASISVTMGGQKLSDTGYTYTVVDRTTATLTIAEVTGDVIIVAEGVEAAPPEITEITLDPTTATIYTDPADLAHTVTITATVQPADADESALMWSSSNSAVATVNNGVVTAVGNGTATITAAAPNNVTATAVITVKTRLTGVTISGTATEGQALTAVMTPAGATAQYQWVRVDGGAETDINGATASAYTLTADDVGKTIKVRAEGTGSYEGTVTSGAFGPVAEAGTGGDTEVAVTGVSLDRSTATILTGGTVTLIPAVSPSNATNKSVLWTSGNSSVAAVDEHGVVTGVSVGTAVITATTVDGGKTASCTVTVVNVMLDKTSASVKVGGTVTLTASVSSQLSSQEVTWASDNEEAATVDADGTVHGVAEGEATITATVDGTEFTASCKVTVTKNTTGPSTPSTDPSAPSNPTPETETREDGSTVTTVTKLDGTVTETVERPDGAIAEKVTDPDGDVTITVTDPEGEELAKVELPAVIPAPEKEFNDIGQASWAEEAIKNMAGLGLINGVGSSFYDPGAPMTRGSLATVLYRLSQGKTYDVPFNDVAQGKYYTEGVAWAAKAGVVTGYTENIFAPDDTITREQLAVMLARYARLIGMDTTADTRALGTFTDGGSTGVWAVSGMAWCVEKGILKGRGANNLAPSENITRAEVAVMLDRFLALIK